jgi:NIPSNAP protein
MIISRWVVAAASTTIFVAGFAVGTLRTERSVAFAQGKHVYELRTYTAPEGKLVELNKRFRDHTIRIFNKHGMKSVLYMTPQDAPNSENTLIYVLEHPSREAAKKAWADFGADEEWKKVSAESQVNGRIVSKVESIFGDPTDYSPMK